MESLDLLQDVPSGDSKQVVNNRNAKWHKSLRKDSVQTPTMQRIDKHGPKITEEHKQNIHLLSLMKSAQASQQFRIISENTPRFKCLKCNDSLEFSMSGLAEHFQETHSGSLPVFPCDMCTYSTHEFSCFQLHRLGHKDTFASCNICHDNVQRTLSELTKHLNMQHSLNGQYLCETCDKFCSNDVGAFLEHIYQHDIALQGNYIDSYSGHRNGNDLFKELMPVTVMLPFQCTLCDFEAPQKWMMTNHLATVHGEELCRNSKRMIEVHPKAIGLVDTTPGPHRMTRNAVKEMDWMSQDCLALPEREFLDKYCDLSNPDRALEETHRFLERSSTAETGGHNWSKTLQNVLSNVPLDMSVLPKSMKGVMRSDMSHSEIRNNGQDLLVFTTNNKIETPQKDVTGDKGFNTVARSESNPFETCPVGLHSRTDTNGYIPDLSLNQSNCLGSWLCDSNHFTILGLNDLAVSTRIHDNIENREVRFDQGMDVHRKNYVIECKNAERPKNPISANDRNDKDQKSTHKGQLTKKSKRRWKRKVRPKTMDTSSPGLKLLLKKNPVKDEQWMSQGQFPQLHNGILEGYQRLAHPHKTLEQTQQFLQRALAAKDDKKKWSKSPKTGLQNISRDLIALAQSQSNKKVISNSVHLNPTSDDLGVLVGKNKISVPRNCTTKPVGFKMVNGQKHVVFKVIPSGIKDNRAELSLNSVVSKADHDSSVGCLSIAPLCSLPSINTKKHEKVMLPNIDFSNYNFATMDNSMESYEQDSAECSAVTHVTLTPCWNSGAKSNALGADNTNDEGVSSSNFCSQEQCGQPAIGSRQKELSTDDFLQRDLHENRPSCQAVRDDSSPADVYHWKLSQRHVKRTLNLSPLSPTQCIKRPAGDQPVVVLNHPDTEVPEVTSIMEVIHRYDGDIQKVVLSRKTLLALSPAKPVRINDSTNPQTLSAGCIWPENVVKERFILKLKLKKMGRKKYKVVEATSHRSLRPLRFSCWFCGRVFSDQETWMVHGQRHLM